MTGNGVLANPALDSFAYCTSESLMLFALAMLARATHSRRAHADDMLEVGEAGPKGRCSTLLWFVYAQRCAHLSSISIERGP